MNTTGHFLNQLALFSANFILRNVETYRATEATGTGINYTSNLMSQPIFIVMKMR